MYRIYSNLQKSLFCRLQHSFLMTFHFPLFTTRLYTGGWNLTFSSSEFSYEQNRLPSSISIRENPSNHRFLEVFCKKCYKKLGTLNAISGFNDLSVNFSAKYVSLYASRYDRSPINQGTKSKWADIANRMSQSNSHLIFF